ncbi:hypothetical protein H632_c4302p0, partial [Helicosporidium sp. ATCC 50920]
HSVLSLPPHRRLWPPAPLPASEPGSGAGAAPRAPLAPGALFLARERAVSRLRLGPGRGPAGAARPEPHADSRCRSRPPPNALLGVLRRPPGPPGPAQARGRGRDAGCEPLLPGPGARGCVFGPHPDVLELLGGRSRACLSRAAGRSAGAARGFPELRAGAGEGPGRPPQPLRRISGGRGAAGRPRSELHPRPGHEASRAPLRARPAQ